jgi:hypothetical protein
MRRTIRIFIVEVEDHGRRGIRRVQIASTFILAAAASATATTATRTRRFIARRIGVRRHCRCRNVHGAR